jgi:ribosome biogenesis protein Nip4
LKFRFAECSEEEAFSRQLKEQLAVTEDQVGEDWRWVIAEGPRIEVYLAPQHVASSLERLLKIRMPYSLGLFAGGMEHGELQVSLELASSLTHLLPKRKMVLLSDEAEQPVLYGRDVLAGSVQFIEGHVRMGELIVLANEAGEILALGQMLLDAPKLKRAAPKQRVIRNLIDKGWYLRKGG